MSKTRVVNIRYEKCEEYIGRIKGTNQHFGNPFSHKTGTLAEIVVGSVEKAVTAYEDWLLERDWIEVEPERREWIINNLYRLEGKTLGCFCVNGDFNNPCHGFVLKKLVERVEK